MSDCPNCGTTPVRDGQRFCAGCGSELPSGAEDTVAAVEPPPAYGQPPRVSGPLFADNFPPPPPPVPAPFAAPFPTPVAAPPPAYPTSENRRRRTPIALLVIAALVAAAIGAGGVVLLLGDADDTKDSSAEDRRADAAPPSPASSAPATAATTSPETSAAERFRCWDGATVTRLAACSLPTGAAGLAWVFPSADDESCSIDAGIRRVAEAECAPLVEGAAVRFHYSEWRSRAEMEAYYGENEIASVGGPPGHEDLTAVQVISRDSSVDYKVAIYYTDPSAPWSVTIYAADEAQYFAAVGLLEALPFQRLRGEPA